MAEGKVIGNVTTVIGGYGGVGGLGSYASSLPVPVAKGGDPRFHEKLARMGDLHDKKNRDYSGGVAAKPLGNFDRMSAIHRLWPGFDWSSPFGVGFAYLLKQLDAAAILYSQKQDSVTGEGIEQRLDDVMVYAGLLGLLYRDEKAANRPITFVNDRI